MLGLTKLIATTVALIGASYSAADTVTNARFLAAFNDVTTTRILMQSLENDLSQ
ncbi:hypothetical protein CERSUDRAFT_101081 [Gelatoporia subvermispora B]|uniref:Uncharacterized protein n=1 Tax=Ceriporiopsis subvermispora (strain B) TaxID=914234 RepID=M2P614_CERS8|nr:hypothetical protein CERSUDRAFT_101081 [Gelatoporia subvermispora B]